MLVGFFLRELSRARQYCPILKGHVLETVSIWEETNDTYKACVRVPSPAAGTVEKPTTSSMSLSLKKKISFINGRSGRQYVPKVHIPTGKGRPFCVYFYTYGTGEDGDKDRTKYYQYLAHNSHNYQNHKSYSYRTNI